MRKIIATRCDICTYVFERTYKRRTMKTIVSNNIGSVPDAYSARTNHLPWKAPFIRGPLFPLSSAGCCSYRSVVWLRCWRLRLTTPVGVSMTYVRSLSRLTTVPFDQSLNGCSRTMSPACNASLSEAPRL